MYPYSYYYGFNALTIIPIAALVAVILGVVVYFTFMSKKNEGKFTGPKEKIYNFLTFNKFYTEDILKFLYVVLASVFTVLGVVMLFINFLTGLLLITVGNVGLRVGYELVMMFIILCRKSAAIDKKLEDMSKTCEEEPAPKAKAPAKKPKAEAKTEPKAKAKPAKKEPEDINSSDR